MGADALCPPGGQSPDDEPDLSGLGRYLETVTAGGARFSIAGAARAMGVSRAYVYRMMSLSTISDAEFEEVLDGLPVVHTMTALSDAVKRRISAAREYEERCPHCGEVLRTRFR